MLLLPLLPLIAGCSPDPEPDAVLDAIGDCHPIPGAPAFATDAGDDGLPEDNGRVDICAIQGAVWWRADLDVDCDGGQADACLEDETWLPETAVTDSDGDYLDASDQPYVVVPLPWNPTAARDTDFFYCDHGLALGGVAVVIYEDRLEYGVIGDEGPVTSEPEGADGECAGLPMAGGVIGEASYAMARQLGIDPDPNTGGVDCGAACPVTYVLFTDSQVEDPGDQREIARVGRERTQALLGE